VSAVGAGTNSDEPATVVEYDLRKVRASARAQAAEVLQRLSRLRTADPGSGM